MNSVCNAGVMSHKWCQHFHCVHRDQVARWLASLLAHTCNVICYLLLLHQVLHRLQNKEKPIRTTFTLRFGSLKMIFECSIARCDVGLGRAIVQCQKNPLRKPKLSINRAILSAHFSAVKFCIGFFCWIGFFLVLHRLFL